MADRVVHVEHCMGTVFSIDIRDPGPWRDAIDAVVVWLHRVDELFSTYRPDSEISRRRRGEPSRPDPLVTEVLDRCAALRAETGGYFSEYWAGELDPTGLVKGWAVERASALLRAHGSADHAVNGGGDVQLAGEAAPGQPWRVGVSDPADRTRVLTVVRGRDLAVATSGTAERGTHIVDPVTGTAADELAAVTVVGRELSQVDAYATAAFAMGASALDWLEALPDHEGLVVSRTGAAHATSGFGALTGPTHDGRGAGNSSVRDQRTSRSPKIGRSSAARPYKLAGEPVGSL
jgi:thiamine biosynthesis lipoprotein